VIGNRSGLIFNNGMDDFSYENRSVNYFGLEETPTNYPQPGKRALSSLAPLIIIDKKTQRPKLVIGAAGGSKIITSLTTAILRFLCDSNDLKEIVDAPRFHHQLVPDVIEYEYGLVHDLISGLEERGHKTSRYRNRGTIINALKIDQRRIHAISDYRKDASGVAGY
jgi:gamma-glutamyltranspeptidase/glutathione hydrolase/leukotriene-C4 hydrolase